MPYFHPYVQCTCMSFVILVHIYPSKTTIDASLWHNPSNNCCTRTSGLVLAPLCSLSPHSWMMSFIASWGCADCHNRGEMRGSVTGHWGIMPHDDDDLIYLLRYFTQGLGSFILRFIHSYIEIIKDLWKCLGLEYNPKFLYIAIARYVTSCQY